MDIVLKTNSTSFPYEKEIVSIIKERCYRGRINLNLNVELNNKDSKLVLNKTKLTSYISIIEKVKKEMKLNETLSLNNILKIPELISKENLNDAHIEHKVLILKTIKSALADLNKFRKIEGVNLFDNIKKIFDNINFQISKIEKLANTHSKKELLFYKNKIKTIIPDYNKLDNDRIYQEIAIIMERKDINEEIIRLKSHMKMFNSYLSSNENVGKKMNFLLQEMIREINTIGAKSDKIKINHLVVDIKDNLEKIKEQVQNIL